MLTNFANVSHHMSFKNEHFYCSYKAKAFIFLLLNFIYLRRCSCSVCVLSKTIFFFFIIAKYKFMTLMHNLLPGYIYKTEKKKKK